MKIKFSWFQKVVLAFFVFISFLQGYITGGDVFYAFGYASGVGIIIFFLMWLFNKFFALKLKTENKVLIKSWQIIRIILTVMMILWIILFLSGGW
jgi:hypothetical protein